MAGRACALAVLAVLQLQQLCAGYRLEGQVLEAEMGQAALSLQDNAELAFASSGGSSSGGKSTGSAKAGADPDPTKAEKDEQCHLAVSGSTWKRSKRCECGEEMMVKCPSEPCNLYGRRFNLDALEGKGCSCSACAVTCEAVPGAKTRTAKWKRLFTGRDCECEEGAHLAGDSDDCKARGKDQRYFKAKKVVDRGCSCMSTETVTPEEEKSGRSLKSEDAAVAPVDDADTKETPKKMWEDPEFGKKIVYGGTSSVVLCCFIMMICKVFKTVSSVDLGEDIDYMTTEATVGRMGSEATEAPYHSRSENQQQKQS